MMRRQKTPRAVSLTGLWMLPSLLVTMLMPGSYRAEKIFLDVRVDNQGMPTYVWFTHLKGPGATADFRILDFSYDLLSPAYVATVDVAFFRVPDDLLLRQDKWESFGIMHHEDNPVNHCCTQELYKAGVCSKPDRLWLNDEVFDGILMSATADVSDGTFRYRKEPDESWLWTVDESGWYVTVVVACSEALTTYYMNGTLAFRSWYGYLPDQMLATLFTMCCLSAGCAILLFTFSRQLWRLNPSDRSMIEKTILLVLVAGLFESVALLSALISLNLVGTWSLPILLVQVFAGIVKQSLGVAGIVMISMGRGKSCVTIALGMLYILLNVVYQIIQYERTWNYSPETFEVMEAVGTAIRTVIYVADGLLLATVLWFLYRTTRYLKAANQVAKLRRYRILGCVLFGALIGVAVVFAVEHYAQQMARPWQLEILSDVLFFLVLVGICYLWWPNPENQDYERIMELPMLDEHGNEILVANSNELEMTDTSEETCTRELA